MLIDLVGEALILAGRLQANVIDSVGSLPVVIIILLTPLLVKVFLTPATLASAPVSCHRTYSCRDCACVKFALFFH